MQSLKTTYVDIRSTYVAHTFLPFVHNFYPYAEQLPKYRSLHKAVLGSVQSYIALPADQYRFIFLPFRWGCFVVGHPLRLCYVGWRNAVILPRKSLRFWQNVNFCRGGLNIGTLFDSHKVKGLPRHPPISEVECVAVPYEARHVSSPR